MNAVVYLLVRQYVNRIRRIFSKPLSAVLTITMVVFLSIGLLMTFIVPKMSEGIVGERGREVFIAGVQLFIGIMLIMSALSQQGGLFTYSEANLLFSSPLSKE